MCRTARLCLLLVILAAPLGAATAPAGTPPATPPLLAPLADAQTLPLPGVDPALPSPPAFLGYSLGARFTRHAEVLAYLDALDAASPRVTAWQYGETYEHRPLRLLAISSAD